MITTPWQIGQSSMLIPDMALTTACVADANHIRITCHTVSRTTMLVRPDLRIAQPTTVTPSRDEQNAMGANACTHHITNSAVSLMQRAS